MEKMILGVSSCLLGQDVRYDGNNKANRRIMDGLSPWFDFLPVCPETEFGLSVPREPMRLEGPARSPRLVTINSRMDLTEPVQYWIRNRITDLADTDLSGFIFKSKSPSCGLRDIQIYNSGGQIMNREGCGLFASAYCQAFPDIPVEDELKIADPVSGYDFMERIMILHRWRAFRKAGDSHGLEAFHRNHKYQFMARSPGLLWEMGQITALSGNRNISQVLEEYAEVLLSLLAQKPSVEKNINALQHVAGYFKKILNAGDKEALRNELEQYGNRQSPLNSVLSELRNLAEKCQEPYLLTQHYLTPHPAQLLFDKESL